MTGSLIAEADGGARGNPGPAGFGAVVKDAVTGAVLVERSGPLGRVTNNVAEYTALIEALAVAVELGADTVTVRMDSRLVIEQMSGRWRIKHPGLRPLAARAAALVERIGTVRFEWIPRERNTHADRLANEAMDRSAGTEPAVGPRSWEPRLEAPTRLILLRHGATEHTASGRYSGRGDVPLSEAGRAQAAAAAVRIAEMAGEVAAVVSSPLSRCAETADAVRAACGVEPVVRLDDDLIECDFGDWEGRTFAEVRAGWPDEMRRWLASPSVAPPGGESFRAVTHRSRRFVSAVRRAYPGKTVVVVSHVSPIKIILREALAAGDEFLHRLNLDAAGISVIDSWPDGGVSVRTVNDTSHLP